MSFSNTASTEAQFNADIAIINGTAGTYSIAISGTILENTDLSVINNSSATVTITGGVLDGANKFRGLFVNAGTVTVNSLTIQNAAAIGGAGGGRIIATTGGIGQGGGGGAGLGGGLFVGSTATVTLNNAKFTNDSARGGAGGAGFATGAATTPNRGYNGGGGLGGAGGTYDHGYAGGGGIGISAIGGGQTLTPIGTETIFPVGLGAVPGASSGGTGNGSGASAVTHAGGASGGGGGSGKGFVKVGAVTTGGGGGGGGIGGGASGTSGIANYHGSGGTGGFGGGGGGGFSYGGNGGFGGGGGGGYDRAGNGGFGGGGAGGGSATSGLGGFGAGSGGKSTGTGKGTTHFGGGGGGLGAGGDIFVQSGGVLNIGPGTLSGGAVAGGAVGQGIGIKGTATYTANGAAGLGLGTGIFIHSGSVAGGTGKASINLSPAVGTTLTINDQVTDQTASGGTGAYAGAGKVIVNGLGLVVLGSTQNNFTGGVSVSAAGTLAMTAVSSFSGGIAIGGGGTVSAAADGDLGANTNNLAFGSGTLLWTNGGTAASSARTMTLNAGGGTIATSGAGLVTMSGAASGVGQLAASGTGSLTFSGLLSETGGFAVNGSSVMLGNASNSFTGGVTLTGGTLAVTSDALLGNAANSLTFGGGELQWNNGAAALSSARAIALNAGGGTVATGGTGLVTLFGTVSGAGGLTDAGAGPLTLSGVLSQTGGLTLGGGTLTLGNAANTFTGGIALNGGTLVAAGNANLGGLSNAVTFGGGTLDWNNGAAAVNSSRNMVFTSSGAIVIAGTGLLTESGSITGAGGLAQTGGRLALTNAANTFSGGIKVTGGTLIAAADGDLGSAANALTLSAGTLNWNNGAAAVTSAHNITLTGNGTILTSGTGLVTMSGGVSGSGGLTDSGTGPLTLSGALSQTGGLVLSSGTLTLTNVANTFSGGINLAGGTLSVGAAGELGAAGNTIIFGGSTLLWTNGATALAVTQGLSLTAGGGTIVTSSGAGKVTMSGAVSGTGALLDAGGGTLALTHAASNFAGGITITAASTLELGATGSGTITFDTATLAPNVLEVDQTALTSRVLGEVVNDFAVGQTIEMAGVTVTAVGIVNSNTLAVTLSDSTVDDIVLDATHNYAAGTFSFFNTGGNAFITDNVTPCYLAGTRVRTDRGEVQVEELAIGDRVVTLNGSTKPIKWIGKRAYSSAFAAGNRDIIPILIKQGALGRDIPERDLYVSPLHAMFFDDVLVQAEHLVNGKSVVRCPHIDPIRYFHIELDQHDVIFAEGAPAETFVDCDSRGMFHNAAEFAQLYPADQSQRWMFCAPRIESGPVLEQIRRVIDTRAGLTNTKGETLPGPLRGNLDGLDGTAITGWAFDADHTDGKVVLDVLDGHGLIARVTANRHRGDLEEAGIGDGRHGFELRLGRALAPDQRHEIRVRRVSDGRELPGSPLVIESRDAQALVLEAQDAIKAAASGASEPAILDSLLDTLLNSADHVRRLRAACKPEQGGDPLLRWAKGPRQRPKQALIIDDRLPRRDRDAGSNAILSHIAALRGLGWEVEFVASGELDGGHDAAAALLAEGVACHRTPHVASVEEVLRRKRGTYDLVYLHRLSNAETYAPMVRAWQPKARVVYSVADLHHVRMARQAAVHGNDELLADSVSLKAREIHAMRMADAVITHSPAEAAYLAREAPGAAVHVVPWAMVPAGRSVPFAERNGVAFIGGMRHAPNPDAVRWLATEIMPRVWARDPEMPCLIVGSDWPALVWGRLDRRIRLLGHVPGLDDVFDQVRLTVAPLRFGAGVKGKVLDSLAAGVPCVMTPIAAEGIPLEGVLRSLVAEGPADLADLICDLHHQPALHRSRARAGLALVGTAYTAEAVAAAMETVVGTGEPRLAGIARTG